MPKIPKKTIYKHGNFRIIPNYQIKTIEQTVLIMNNHEVISLLSKEIIKNQKYKYEFINIELV